MKPWYLRTFLWPFGLLYRINVAGRQNVPASGGALLVSNHVSFVDMLLILSASPRFIRFVLPQSICDKKWLKSWLRRLGAIPLPEETKAAGQAFAAAREAIQSGELVALFAERQISRIGLLLPFGPECEHIIKDLEAPIIPVFLDGVWGSIFSFQGGRFFWKLPRLSRDAVSVNFGASMPAHTSAVQVRSAIQDLSSAAWGWRRQAMRPLGQTLVINARRRLFRFAMADQRVPGMTFGQSLAKTVFLARRLRRHWKGQRMVGICLPPSAGAALVNFAVLLAGKVPVNLNYTLAAETLAACSRQCDLRLVISSKLFLDRAKVTLPIAPLLMEELASRPRWTEKLIAGLLAVLAPVGWLEKTAGSEGTPGLDDLATIVFSSGSTGDPKGVMLSHYNVLSNVEQLAQGLDFDLRMRLLGVLPFFHSFGFTGTLLKPALCGLGVVYHSNPLDGKMVGELVRRYGLTVMIATPGFLQIYLKTCTAADFGSLTFVMAGAEKLPDWLAAEFQKKFGVLPVEGYGCTECAPAISANTRNFRGPGIVQTGARRGTIGAPLPGVSVRIVAPETRTPVPTGQPGLLLVRGPNVMRGYLGKAEKTAEVLRDGWYETGDIARVHEDGFLEITDRISRFSKIAGEMVPHIKVETRLTELAGIRDATAFAVVGVPDEKRGERLVVLHTLEEPALSEVLSRLSESGLPNLWLPKTNQFFHVDTIPLTGTGKLDLRKVREMAMEFSEPKTLPAAQSA